MSSRKVQYHRPYSFEDRQKLAELIRLHGARATRELCTRTVCTATLRKIAREFDIPLKKGRRALRAA